jgi:hypothetical protein
VQQQKITDTALRLLYQTRLGPGELRSFQKKASSIEYWRELNPKLKVCSEDSRVRPEERPLSSQETAQLLKQFSTDGFIQTPKFLSEPLIRRMRTCAETLVHNDWPAVFAFVYDEFWLLPRVPSLKRFLRKTLGRQYLQLPHLWCHFINTAPGHSGWAPHVDGPMNSGRVSLWFPLSDATLDNGCMYVIPKGRVPEDAMLNFARGQENATPDEVRILLQSTRALPATAGSVIGWEFGLIHWGASVGAAGEPRISFSLEFIGQGVSLQHYEKSLIDPELDLPSFQERIRIIGTCIWAYQKFEPRMVRFLDLAEQLAARSAKPQIRR